MIGETIGKYRFVEKLGRGGMGTVYKAIDESLDREVAIKVLNPELAETEAMKRFRAEGTTLAKLNHPEIATIYELYRSESDLFMVLEFVRGETLDQLSNRCGPLPPERAAYLVAQVLGALEHAHRAGVVHRDLKPANVMVTELGGIKIMDFGIARVVGAEHMTTDGFMMGTPAYMAPEQVLGQEVDSRADLYSAGIVFYRLLTGDLPFKAETAIGMVQKQITDVPTPARERRAGLPEWCDQILERALIKSPTERFQTAEEFRAALLSHIGAVAAEHTQAVAAGAIDVTTPPRAIMASASAVRPAAMPLASVPPAAMPTSGAPMATAPMPPGVQATGSVPIDGTTIVMKKNQFAAAAVLLTTLVVGVGVLAFVALRRGAPAAPQTQSAAPASPSAAPALEATAPAAAQTAPQPPPGAVVSTRSSAPGAASVARGDAAAAGEARSGAAKAPVADPVLRRKKTAAAALLPLAFDAKALVMEGTKVRDRDAKVVLDEAKVTVTAQGQTLSDMPYAAIVGVSYSKSKQPLWNSPTGPTTVTKVGGGAFGFLKGDRNWVSLRTKEASIVLRIDDEQVDPVLTGFEKRLGQPVDRVVER